MEQRLGKSEEDVLDIIVMSHLGYMRTSQKRIWDNYAILDYAKKGSREEGRQEEQLKALAEKKEIVLQMKRDGFDIDRIVKYTKLSKEQIEALI